MINFTLEIPRYMPDLESEKFAEQRRRNQEGQGLKILTPDQMLSSLPITLAQLKLANNSKKTHKNKTRKLLYSLYHSKKLTKTIYNNLINTIGKWKQFMNTENSKTNEPHRFRLRLADKFNLKYSNENMAIKSAYNNNTFKFLLQLGMMNLIDHILF